MQCLIIDNYDSFTWNLGDYVAQIFGIPPLVVRNDEYSWSQLKELGPFSSIVVSPGPGSVTNPADFNVSRDALAQDEIPVLGVCLGFQGLVHIYGGDIRHAPVPFHGRTSLISHDCADLFSGIPDKFAAVRYHSLIVDALTLPAQLCVTARSDCGLLMGVRHVSLPKWGIQFHPESILTAYGNRIITNFRDLAYRHRERCALTSKTATHVLPSLVNDKQSSDHTKEVLHVRVRKLSGTPTAENVFLKLFADERNVFWLDSQRIMEGMSRYSFMGCVPDDAIISCRIADADAFAAAERHLRDLERALEGSVVEGADELPFEFRGGYIGFMTYEMKALMGAKLVHRNRIPDSMWMRVHRFVVFDHIAQQIMLVAVGRGEEDAEITEWMETVSRKLEGVGHSEHRPRTLGLDSINVTMDMGIDEYLAAIQCCKDKIIDGESYEVCLTNGFSFDALIDPVELYLVMRRENAAPFGAFIRSGNTCVISTSPERFIKVDSSGCVQSKPIKGTCARAEDAYTDRANAARLAGSEKDRAENLMIVDLMRNDLGRISIPGSITVPKLMDIESYQTVHQMVSTVESSIRPECTLLDLLRAVFPGGSITGAPKIRTMEIIDQLEPAPRGVYCGTIGYLGYNRIADLNIAIRSLSYDGRTVRFGAGGAITYLSDPKGEFDEILLKAEAVLGPIWHYLNWLNSPVKYRLVDDQLCLQELVASMTAS